MNYESFVVNLEVDNRRLNEQLFENNRKMEEYLNINNEYMEEQSRLYADFLRVKNNELKTRNELEKLINIMSTKIAKKEHFRKVDFPQRVIDVLDLCVEPLDAKLKMYGNTDRKIPINFQTNKKDELKVTLVSYQSHKNKFN